MKANENKNHEPSRNDKPENYFFYYYFIIIIIIIIIKPL